MAVLKGSVIGQLKGKLGDLTARIIDGRTILAQRPTSFKVNYSPTMVEIRKKFACAGALAKSFLSLSTLYTIWLSVKEAHMSVFNYALKRNYAGSSADKPTVDNIISPADGFAPPVTTATVAADKVTIEMPALNTVTVISPEERVLSTNGVLCYYNPTNPDEAPYAFTAINNEIEAFDFELAQTVDLPLNVLQSATSAKYQNSILYFAVVTKDIDGKIYQHSATFAQDN